MNKAYLNDSLLLFNNRPLQFLVLRATGSLGKSSHIPTQGYFINDVELAKQIFDDEKNFTNNQHGALGDIAQLIAGNIPLLVNMHGKEHAKLRGKVMSAFNLKYVRTASTEILQPFVAAQVEKLKQGQKVDLAALIQIVTNRMTSFMLGLDYDEQINQEVLLEISELTAKLTKTLALGKKTLSKQEIDTAQHNYRKLQTLLSEQFQAAGTNDQSLIAKLKQSQLTEEVVIGIITILLVAGTETVSSGLPRGVALLHDSKEWSKLIATPADSEAREELIESTISEILRFTSPSPLVLHGVLKDNITNGIKFKAGERVFICQYNILHQRKYNRRPNKFDITRQQNSQTKYFWFGHGAHYCIGAALAMEEIRVVLRELARPSRSLKIQTRRFSRNSSFPNYKSLVISYI